MIDTSAVIDIETLRPRIEIRAYEIWVHEGCPQGQDLDHWLRAESEIAEEAMLPEDTAASPAKK
jgi:hypothetical protein